MAALTAKAALVDPEAFAADEQAVTTTIPRAEVEEALRAEESPDLFIDVQRSREGETEGEQRVTVSWEPADLERLLSSSTGDAVTFAFKPEELAQLLEEPDVEAQGLREKMAILTVAATTAAGIAAGAATAQVATDAGAGGGTTAPAAFVTDTTSGGPASSLQSEEHAFRVSEASAADESGGTQFVTDTTSSGPAAADESGGTQFVTDTTSSGPSAAEQAGGTAFLTDATSSGPQEATAGGDVTNLVTDTTSSGPQEAGAGLQAEEHAFRVSEASAADTGGTNLVTDTTSSGPQQVEAAPAGGGGESFLSTAGGQAALVGGIALLITGAGFLGTRQRGRLQPT